MRARASRTTPPPPRNRPAAPGTGVPALSGNRGRRRPRATRSPYVPAARRSSLWRPRRPTRRRGTEDTTHAAARAATTRPRASHRRSSLAVATPRTKSRASRRRPRLVPRNLREKRCARNWRVSRRARRRGRARRSAACPARPFRRRRSPPSPLRAFRTGRRTPPRASPGAGARFVSSLSPRQPWAPNATSPRRTRRRRAGGTPPRPRSTSPTRRSSPSGRTRRPPWRSADVGGSRRARAKCERGNSRRVGRCRPVTASSADIIRLGFGSNKVASVRTLQRARARWQSRRSRRAIPPCRSAPRGSARTRRAAASPRRAGAR